MRIGIDMLSIQSPGSVGRDSSRLGRRLVSSLIARRSGHHFVVYSREALPVGRSQSSKGRASIPDVIEYNPDGLDWLVLLDPFSSGTRGIPPRAKLDGVKLASVIADLTPGRIDEKRLAPLRTHDTILTFSEEAEVECLERLSTSANQIIRLGLGLDHSWIHGETVELGAELLQGLEINRPFLFANLAAGPEESNLAGILDAYRLLPTSLRDGHQLVIAGKVADPWAAIRFLQDWDCAEGLVLVGRVDDSMLRLLYGRCAAFLSPSLDRASGLSIVEAMGRGAAIIAGRGGSQSSVLGGAGLVADPSDPTEIADKVACLLSDLELSEMLRRKALERSLDFPWEPVVERFLNAIEPDASILVALTDHEVAAVESEDWIRDFIPPDQRSDDLLESELNETEVFDDNVFAGLSWEDVTIHVLADVFSVRSRRRELEQQPGLVLFRDESSIDRIEFANGKKISTLADVEAEVACSRLLEIFATSSRVAVRSSRNLAAIRSRFPEYADRVVLIPPRSGILPRGRDWAAGSAGTAASGEVSSPVSSRVRATLIGHQGDVHQGSSFPRMPGLTPLPLDV